MNKTIENILKVFTESKETSLKLSELKDKINNGVTGEELLICFQQLRRLFKLSTENNEIVIKVEIILRACPDYNNPAKGCFKKDNCQFLHTCERRLSNVYGCKCPLSHIFIVKEIRTLLTTDRFDYNSLMKFYQVFYSPSKAKPPFIEADNKKKNSESDNESVMTNDSSSSKRRVYVKLPENFIKERSQKQFFDMFAKQEITGGGFIDNLVYTPESRSAVITYKSGKTAKRVIFRKEIMFDGFKFTVKQYYDNTTQQKRPTKPNKETKEEDFLKAEVIEPISDNVASNEVFCKYKVYLVLDTYKDLNDDAKVVRISTILAKSKPQSCRLVDPSIGKWLIEFTPDEKIEIGELWKTYEVANKFLPSNIKIEPVRNETRNEATIATSSNESKNTNQNSLKEESNVTGRKRQRRRRRNKDEKENNGSSVVTGQQTQTYILKKSLVKNENLSIVLKGRNSWLGELKDEFEKQNATFVFDKDSITITPMEKVCETASQKDWYIRMNRVISDFFAQFKKEKIAYSTANQPAIEELKIRIRSSQLIQYFDDPKAHRLFIMGKIYVFDDFFNKNAEFKELLINKPPPLMQSIPNKTSHKIIRTEKTEQFKEMMKRQQQQQPMKIVSSNKKLDLDLESTQIVSRNEKLPKYLYDPYKSLITKLLDYLKAKFELNTYFINPDSSDVDFIGYSSSANQVATTFNTSLSRIKTTNMINDLDVRLLKAKHLESIVNHSLTSSDLIFQIKVRTIDSKEEPGIFVSYFRNVPEINSSDDSVYESVKKIITSTIEYDEIGIAKQQAHLFLTSKWTQLNNEHFNAQISSNNFEIVFNQATVKTGPVVSLIGKKTYLWQVKTKIEQFLTENETKSSVITLDRERVLYLQNLMTTDIKLLEKTYDIKVLFDNTNLILENCPEKILKEVTGKINKLFDTKVSNIYDFGPVPGIDKVMAQKLIYADIEEVQKSTQTLLEIKVNKLAPKITNSISDEQIQTQLTGNETLMTVRVNDSIINLQSGNITNCKVDSILNLISEKPETDQGILSRAIYKAAGIGVLNRILKVKYEANASEELIFTSAGNLDKTQYIFHYNLAKYSKPEQGILAIRTVVEKCLKKVEELKLKSIAFPTLGLGKQHFPLEIVSKQLLTSVLEFLNQNKSLILTVNVVIFEGDKSYNQPFLNEMKTINEKYGKHKEEIQNAASNSLSLKVTSNTRTQLDVGQKRFVALLNEKYLKRDTIDKALLSRVETNEVRSLLKSLSDTYKDCQITYVNRSIELYGTIQSVLESKARVLEYVNKLDNTTFTRMQEDMRISKDIQWQYEIGSGVWKNFPVYLNSLIESKHAEGNPTANFVNEDNDNSHVFFNVNPMIYVFGNVHANLRRVDVTKYSTGERFSFPSNWSPMQGNADYLSVDVGASDPEYIQVYNDFCIKLGARPTTFKLRRVQNPYLYKQYSTHKEKILKEKRSPNEMRLFHGSQEDSLMKICRFGFNRSYCGKNGVAYGQGVYFAVKSQYSHTFAGASKDGMRCMLRAMVLVGDSCIGDKSMRIPPEKTPGSGVLYDSTSDGGSIFVCYHDNQCYPEYLIYYN